LAHEFLSDDWFAVFSGVKSRDVFLGDRKDYPVTVSDMFA
jgi:hypothetical protein